MRNLSKIGWMFMLLIIPLMFSCKKDSTEPDVIASFTFTVDATDFKTINFTSESQNYASLSWNFGDNTAASSEINPKHTYAAVGDYTVKLTATSPKGVTDVFSAKVSIADPNAFLTMLVGDVSKTWKLLRSTATGRFPLEVGPWDRSTIWWAVGNGNDELAIRHCMLNDEWTFKRDGTFTYDTKGDYWAEGGVFSPDNICANTSSMVGPNGEDLSAWGDGTHTFELTAGSNPTLKAIGMGAFVGFYKLGNMAETKVPLDHVTYNIVKLTDGPVDTLIIEGQYKWDATDGGYWRFVLMHYDDPSQEPPIPGNKPSAGFTMVINGLTVTFTNTTTGADSYLWDFGDGTTSTEANPVHTYAGGPYNVTLSATNANGTATTTSVIFLSSVELTDAMLQGGAWRIKNDDKTVFVGGAMGSSAWWSVPKAFFNTGTGGDNWTCMPDDEFIFSAGGHFSYATMGSARNDGYFGTPNGCWSDAEIAASATGKFFGTCDTHTYTFTPANGTNRAIITLTNGADHVAFLGFYKGYNGIASGIKGGENNGTDPANFGSATNTYEVMGYANTGTKEYLFVSVDISTNHDGTASWSAILER